MTHHSSLVLASSSPRRRVLLPLLGYSVKVRPVRIEEQPLNGETPLQTALRLAEAKACAAGRPRPGEVVVAADTIVALGDRPIGKPADAGEAGRTLERLRGRPHEVISGVALIATSGDYRGAVRTVVHMRRYSTEEVECYVESGRPLDKAGAYAIQDRDFNPVERIEGCYLNVVGLPLCEVCRGLRAVGRPLPAARYTPPCQWCEIGKTVLDR
jgi:MAF protein